MIQQLAEIRWVRVSRWCRDLCALGSATSAYGWGREVDIGEPSGTKPASSPILSIARLYRYEAHTLARFLSFSLPPRWRRTALNGQRQSNHPISQPSHTTPLYLKRQSVPGGGSGDGGSGVGCASLSKASPKPLQSPAKASSGFEHSRWPAKSWR